MTELEAYIHSYFGIQDTHMTALAELFRETALKKGEYFTRIDTQCQKLSFIRSGHLRVFAYKEDKDITQWISSQGEFVTDLASMVFKTPSRWNIQALTDCELYSISKEKYDEIGKIIPQWDQLEKLFLAKCFLTLEDRVYSFLSMSAEQRYLQLFEKKQDLFNETPLHYLASMLGMTPETLSRIRKAQSLEKNS
ncbi:MAG: Crp/Fnr family transcriptional regulator [Bacteroidia bacterium]|nr:Crp/Fnr family transcriptional regulator [Bacteroidia bacterium]